LTSLSDNAKPGRFTLYSTENIYNFMLLDQEDGRSWQVQWSIEQEKRLIFPMLDWIDWMVTGKIDPEPRSKQPSTKSSTPLKQSPE
jgi:hypothetical protein